MEEVVEKKTRKEKVMIEHTDILGQPIDNGSYLAVSHHNQLQVCQVIKINPKTLRVKPLNPKKSKYYWRNGDYQVFPDQTVRLTGPDALVYILANTGSE